MAIAITLGVFFVYDTIKYKAELKAGSKPPESGKEPLGLEGGLNFLWLGLIIVAIFGSGMLAKTHFIHEMEISSPILTEVMLKVGQAVAMLLIAGASLWTTAKKIREANSFNYAPILEVAVLFIGIFLTMIPALWILDELGRTGKLGLDQPWQFFWASGGLSSFLDNAPTYLTFSSAASGLHDGYVAGSAAVTTCLATGITHTDANNLTLLLGSTGNLAPLCDGAGNIIREGAMIAPGPLFLKAISCGAVFMGANTYIGNGPNFMVKTIAEQQGVKMPSFFGYMVYSIGILIPIFIAITFIFFR
jgi:Na+/H+ antiporter NhaD/arsenite permease-like protein